MRKQCAVELEGISLLNLISPENLSGSYSLTEPSKISYFWSSPFANFPFHININTNTNTMELQDDFNKPSGFYKPHTQFIKNTWYMNGYRARYKALYRDVVGAVRTQLDWS